MIRGNIMKSLIIVAAATLLATGAQAASYTYAFTAEFNGIALRTDADTFIDTVATFSTITGTITLFDLVAFAGNPATYIAPVVTFDQFAVSEFEGAPTWLFIENDGYLGKDTIGTLGGTVEGDNFGFSLVDDQGSALMSAAVPANLNLSDFEAADFFFSTIDRSNPQLPRSLDFVLYSITSLTPLSDIPLPAGLPLLGAGLLGLGLLRRRA